MATDTARLRYRHYHTREEAGFHLARGRRGGLEGCREYLGCRKPTLSSRYRNLISGSPETTSERRNNFRRAVLGSEVRSQP
jgi:hypothetical protein